MKFTQQNGSFKDKFCDGNTHLFISCESSFSFFLFSSLIFVLFVFATHSFFILYVMSLYQHICSLTLYIKSNVIFVLIYHCTFFMPGEDSYKLH